MRNYGHASTNFSVFDVILYAHSVRLILLVNKKRSDKMTPIGIIRKVDDLGRIVIPKEIRKFYHINANDEIEIVTTPDGIILRKPEYEVRKIECED